MLGEGDRKRSILGTRVEVWAVKRLARRAALVIQDRFHGPIPARAGQPHGLMHALACVRAYPRSRGATVLASDSAMRARGLSPLARGNLRAPLGLGAVVGPIPARAGQPCKGCDYFGGTTAYPRSRGATRRSGGVTLRSMGLSPLARGNHGMSPALLLRQGPIPARAGQPAWPTNCGQSCRAYPRSRGATASALSMSTSGSGLSPLARGNLV